MEWKEAHLKNKFLFNKNMLIKHMMMDNVKLTVPEIYHFVNSFIHYVQDALLSGKEVKLHKFGRFYLQRSPKKIHKGFNSKNKSFVVEERVFVRFSPSTKFKQQLKEAQPKLLKEHEKHTKYKKEMKNSSSKNLQKYEKYENKNN